MKAPADEYPAGAFNWDGETDRTTHNDTTTQERKPMTTNITDLAFTDGTQINVVKNGDTYTYVCSTYEEQEHGVMLEYTDNETLYRVLVPWHQIDRIYQEA